MAKRDTVNKNN